MSAREQLVSRAIVRRPPAQFPSSRRRVQRARADAKKINRTFFRLGAVLRLQEAALAFACGRGQVVEVRRIAQ